MFDTHPMQTQVSATLYMLLRVNSSVTEHSQPTNQATTSEELDNCEGAPTMYVLWLETKVDKWIMGWGFLQKWLLATHVKYQAVFALCLVSVCIWKRWAFLGDLGLKCELGGHFRAAGCFAQLLNFMQRMARCQSSCKVGGGGGGVEMAGTWGWESQPGR